MGGPVYRYRGAAIRCTKGGSWVGEMEEIAGFTGPEAAAVYRAVAGFYEGMAADNAGPREKAAALSAFLRQG